MERIMLKFPVFRLSWLMAFVAVIALASPVAHTQTLPFLDLAVSSQSRTAAPGESPFWDITLINNNADTAYVLFQGFADGLGAVPDVSVPSYNFAPFGHQYTIAPGGSLNIANMFQTIITAQAVAASYTSTAEVTYDLYDSSTFTTALLTDATAAGDWTLTIRPNAAAATPEPGSVALLAGLCISGAGLLARRRNKTRKPV
jgi:hypothetical protein